MTKKQKELLHWIQLLVLATTRMQDEFLDAFLHEKGCSKELCPAKLIIDIEIIFMNVVKKFGAYCRKKEREKGELKKEEGCKA